MVHQHVKKQQPIGYYSYEAEIKRLEEKLKRLDGRSFPESERAIKAQIAYLQGKVPRLKVSGNKKG